HLRSTLFPYTTSSDLDRGLIQPRGAIEVIDLRPARNRRRPRDIARSVVHEPHHLRQRGVRAAQRGLRGKETIREIGREIQREILDRKSTRLNSSHVAS